MKCKIVLFLAVFSFILGVFLFSYNYSFADKKCSILPCPTPTPTPSYLGILEVYSNIDTSWKIDGPNDFHVREYNKSAGYENLAWGIYEIYRIPETKNGYKLDKVQSCNPRGLDCHDCLRKNSNSCKIYLVDGPGSKWEVIKITYKPIMSHISNNAR